LCILIRRLAREEAHTTCLTAHGSQVKWNERVARLEKEIIEERERRKKYESELKQLQVRRPVAGPPMRSGP
jgi:hypothetical protein